MATTRIKPGAAKALSSSARTAVREASPREATKAETAASKRKATKRKEAAHPHPNMDLDQAIQVEAYFRAEQRGFAPGMELEDWLDAERIVIDRLMAKASTAMPEH